MRKTLTRSLSLAMFFSALIATIGVEPATYKDDFNDNSLHSDWVLENDNIRAPRNPIAPKLGDVPVEVKEANGVLHFFGKGGAPQRWDGVRAKLNYPLTSCDVQVDLVKFSGKGGGWLSGISLKRVVDDANHWIFMGRGDLPGSGAWWGLVITGMHLVGGAEKDIWVEKFRNFKFQLPHTFRLVTDGEKVDFYIQGEKAHTEEVDLGGKFTVGLWSGYSEIASEVDASLDNFSITSPDVPASSVSSLGKLAATWAYLKKNYK